MKSKILFNAIIAIISAITSLSLILIATSSWYKSVDETSQEFQILADGVLYIYLPAAIEFSGQSLIPAVAMPYAALNGLYMDALTLYNEQDETPSYVSKIAQVASYSTNFIFYNQYSKLVQQTDEFGNPVYDEFGNPLYVQAVDEFGDPMYDELGNPIYVTEPYPANISYVFAIKDTPSEDMGNYIDTEELTLKELYFSYSSQPIAEGLPINEENGAILFTEAAADKTSGTVRVEGTREIFIHMQVYLTNVDELLDPSLRATMIYLEIELSVMLDGYTPEE